MKLRIPKAPKSPTVTWPDTLMVGELELRRRGKAEDNAARYTCRRGGSKHQVVITTMKIKGRTMYYGYYTGFLELGSGCQRTVRAVGAKLAKTAFRGFRELADLLDYDLSEEVA